MAAVAHYGFDREKVEAINAARDALAEIKAAAWAASDFTGGKVYEAAKVADDALFELFNVAHNHGGVPLTPQQLHNWKPDENAERLP